jgi:hypothetical protein
MKHLGHTISILKDTNRAVCSSDSDWSVVRPGSFIRFAKDDTFFVIAKTNKIFYIKDFKVENIPDGRKITIADDIGINLCRGDTLNITYKEWTLLTLMDIKNPGKGYKVNDKVFPKGGILANDSVSNIKSPTTFRVTGVDENGGIKNVALESEGLYLEAPVGECEGGSGSGAELDVEYKPVDNRKMMERTVMSVSPGHIESSLVLNYPLPVGVKIGKLSVQKWEIILTSTYLFDSKVGETYAVTRDFTPNLNLPLMSANSLGMSTTYNQSAQRIDSEIASLKDQIKELRSLIKQ